MTDHEMHRLPTSYGKNCTLLVSKNLTVSGVCLSAKTTVRFQNLDVVFVLLNFFAPFFVGPQIYSSNADLCNVRIIHTSLIFLPKFGFIRLEEDQVEAALPLYS